MPPLKRGPRRLGNAHDLGDVVDQSVEAALYRFDHHARTTPTTITASATSIQFWMGIPPKITPCLTNQSTGAHPKKVI
jgi:hypothetical protein